MNLNEYQNYHETKSHTVSEFPYNTYLCSIPLDFSLVPLHWHAEFELIVIKKGRGLVSVDLNRQPVSAGAPKRRAAPVSSVSSAQQWISNRSLSRRLPSMI